MIAVNESQDLYLSSFAELEKKLADKGPSWVDRIRHAAIDRFAEVGFPTTHDEEWKYTSVAPIARTPFQPAVGEVSVAALHERRTGGRRPPRQPFADLECSRLAFVDGHYSPELSSTGALPPGVKVASLAAAVSDGVALWPLLEAHLARYAEYEDHAFVALNTAFMEDGAFVEIPKDLVLEKPIHLLFISTVGARHGVPLPPTVTHPRNLILVGRRSQVTFIESYVALDVALGTRNSKIENAGVYFTNAVTEVIAGEGAVIDYCKVQQESEPAFHVAALQFQQERSSTVNTYSIALGGALVREEIRTVLGGEGAECTLNGLYVTTGQQHVDNHTTIDHAKPHCGSRELYKGVLDGKSMGVFNGKIIVRKDAQKTDSKQSNKNLLLSEDAVINTKPQLEIYADDVKCTHGATIGQIDPEAIFYLRSRGIAREEARNMLTQAFANDIIGRIKFEPLRARLKEALLARLAKREEPEVRSQKSEGPHGRISTLREL